MWLRSSVGRAPNYYLGGTGSSPVEGFFFYNFFNCSLPARINSLLNVRFLTFSPLMIWGCGRRGGLMVSALNSGSNGPGSSPGRGTVLCSWARHFTPIVPLSTQVYKWVPANLLPGVILRWTSIPSRGE